jgi:transaldolase
VVKDTVKRDLDGARKLLDDLAQAGVDYDDVVETLEREGVEKFADSFAELLEGVRQSSRELVAA